MSDPNPQGRGGLERDAVYARPRQDLVDFSFDEAVARVFPDMIRRSVPGYETLNGLLGVLAERYVLAGTSIYDLGCSLGAASASVRRRVRHPGTRIVAVDSAEAMTRRCRVMANREPGGPPVDVVCADMRHVRIDNASLVIINLSLQFLPPQNRQGLLQGIFDGLVPGGALVLTEKLAFEEPAEGRLHASLHEAVKRANGYSELEIGQKRAALERILLPDTREAHVHRLREVGFDEVYEWFRCLNFVSLLAVKP